ncbi:JNK1-associated membrane protein, partial [Caligus rogercresseyi]
MSLFVLVLHWIFIDTAAKRRKLTREVLLTHLCAALEVGLSSGLSLLWASPLVIFSHWYTALHNPNPNYEETIHCTTEAIYPLYTLIFPYAPLKTSAMLFRALLCCRGGKRGGPMPEALGSMQPFTSSPFSPPSRHLRRTYLRFIPLY